MIFFFNDTATTEIYTLSLHDALPISTWEWSYIHFAFALLMPVQPWLTLARPCWPTDHGAACRNSPLYVSRSADRKSTRLNSSHANISYAVFCLKKKTLLEDGKSQRLH